MRKLFLLLFFPLYAAAGPLDGFYGITSLDSQRETLQTNLADGAQTSRKSHFRVRPQFAVGYAMGLGVGPVVGVEVTAAPWIDKIDGKRRLNGSYGMNGIVGNYFTPLFMGYLKISYVRSSPQLDANFGDNKAWLNGVGGGLGMRARMPQNLFAGAEITHTKYHNGKLSAQGVDYTLTGKKYGINLYLGYLFK